MWGLQLHDACLFAALVTLVHDMFGYFTTVVIVFLSSEEHIAQMTSLMLFTPECVSHISAVQHALNASSLHLPSAFFQFIISMVCYNCMCELVMATQDVRTHQCPTWV